MLFRNVLSLAFAITITTCASFGQQSAVKSSKVVRLRGNVLAIEDSDRVKIAADDGSVYSATLIAVDAPDDKQSYYKKAKKRLAELVDGKDVTVMLRTDEKNESYAVIYAGAEDVGLRLIIEGLAWYAPGRSGPLSAADRQKYEEAQASAKEAGAGLWGEKNPVAPWTFRGEKSELPTDAQPVAVPAEMSPKSVPVPGRTYILGPRGGCYYLNEQGIKVYVKDKTLCPKPQ